MHIVLKSIKRHNASYIWSHSLCQQLSIENTCQLNLLTPQSSCSSFLWTTYLRAICGNQSGWMAGEKPKRFSEQTRRGTEVLRIGKKQSRCVFCFRKSTKTTRSWDKDQDSLSGWEMEEMIVIFISKKKIYCTDHTLSETIFFLFKFTT